MDIKKKILITGGAGYIGVPVIEELINKNLDIVVLDRFSFDEHSLKSFSKYENLKIINGDIRDNNILSECLKNVDTVIHLAALVGEAACKISEEETKSINFDATINLCQLAKKYLVKKFIFMSTASSYGVQDVNEIADENTKLNPVSLYARTKIDSEKSILDNFSEDLDISIFRPSTVYGHSLRMRFDLILNHLIKDAIQKKEIKVFGPEMVRPLMWVGEPARVYSKIIKDDTSKYKSQIFNLGYNNENYKKIDIAKTVQENFFKDIKIEKSYQIENTHRAVGTRISYELYKKYNNAKLNDDYLTLNFEGSAGQSFGAFGIKGLKLVLSGDANDYVGKGLSGGKIVIKLSKESNLISKDNTIIGNTVLYGATSGKLFAAGQAGERFAVRNSGATAVVEGCDSNGCEYMTGGNIVILGNTGDNFAAGMTGGMAFIYDKEKEFEKRVNPESVIWQGVETKFWQEFLKKLVEEHSNETSSNVSKKILENFDKEIHNFIQVCPKEMIDKLENPITNKISNFAS